MPGERMNKLAGIGEAQPAVALDGLRFAWPCLLYTSDAADE